MALIDDYALSTDNSFIQRVKMAIISTAIAVQSEAISTANHSQRSSYAILVLANPDRYAQIMAPGMTVDGSTNVNSTDAALETRASAIFNAYACQT